jgi:hypothetical protein
LSTLDFLFYLRYTKAMAYINDPKYEVPENTLLVYTGLGKTKEFADEVILPLSGQDKRGWFTSHFYYCLPLVIGNQYGFAIKSMYGFNVTMPSNSDSLIFEFDEDYDEIKQTINEHFGYGIITVTNKFLLRTPPGINIMTMQPPNYFIPGLNAMTGVVESDNIRMSFTFNIKVTLYDTKIRVNKGDLLAAFLPIPRYSVENYKLEYAYDVYDDDVLKAEDKELKKFTRLREGPDKKKPHGAGRLYFKGKHPLGGSFKDHQRYI